MLHLIFYLKCLANAYDVREQNRNAFELYKLGNNQNDDSTLEDTMCNEIDEEDVEEENAQYHGNEDNEEEYEQPESQTSVVNRVSMGQGDQ